MGEKETIELLVEGGKASPGPATAPKLGAYKLNIGEVFQKINQATAAYKGMQVPVKLIIDKDTKDVSVEVGTPPVSSLIKKELGIEKAKTKAAEEAEKAAAAAEAVRTAEATAEKPEAEETKAEKIETKEEVKEEVEEEKPPAEEAKVEEEVVEEKPEEKVETKEEGHEEVVEEVKNIHRQEVIGNLKMDQVVKIAKMKMDDLLAKDLKSAVKMVVGTANSMMGIQIEGKWPKDVVKDINKGKWDSVIK
jgi:large subunit ribosomal protein L11